jgi:hypothetical protein
MESDLSLVYGGTQSTGYRQSSCWRVGVAVVTVTWSAGNNVIWNASMDTIAVTRTATTAFVDGMIHCFMHF